MVPKFISSVTSFVLPVTLIVCATLSQQQPSSAAEYDVEVIRTTYGIPHITAKDYGSLGYGEGYVSAQDHVCNIMDSIITANGEQSKYFGPGKKNENVIGDIVHRALGFPERSQELFPQLPVEIQQWFKGYAAGFNRYLSDHEITSWCKSDKIARDITEIDLLCRALTATQTLPRFGAMIASAHPPTDKNGKTKGDAAVIAVAPELIASATASLVTNPLGSNGWAIGKDRTENGRGMLLGNPHFPWNGTNRFWEKHLIIPGKLNMYGAGLIGIPGVTIGFNEHVGWTHTVSNSKRTVLYKLKLVPGDPTSYFYDGAPRKMSSRTVSVPINTGDGKTVTKEQTVWFSHYGPMLSMAGLKWTEKYAYSVRAANMENHYALDQWKEMSTAKDMDDLIGAHRKWNAMPWVNTIATSSDGRAVFLDNSSVGNLSDEAFERWDQLLKSDLATRMVFNRTKMMLADGSDSRFEWLVDPSTKIKGVLPFDKKPLLDRTDFVFNSNDSYWLTNPSAPLTGYSPLFGPTGTPRSIRTRVNAKMLSDISAAGHAGEDGRFSLAEMQNALFSNRSLAAELLREELVAACEGVDAVDLEGEKVDIREARQIIADYNGQLDLDSKGAVLFREWLTAYAYNEMLNKSSLFAVPFDVNDPVNTPRGLADKTVAQSKLAHAVTVLNRAGLALDSTLADVQFAFRSGTNIAVPGGNRHEGVANLMLAGSGDWRGYEVGATKIDGSSTLTDKGYPVIHGSSFLLCLSFTDGGPHAEAVLSYSQSGDPSSPHYTDQTRMFAKEQLRPVLFRKQDIDANVISSKVLTSTR